MEILGEEAQISNQDITDLFYAPPRTQGGSEGILGLGSLRLEAQISKPKFNPLVPNEAAIIAGGIRPITQAGAEETIDVFLVTYSEGVNKAKARVNRHFDHKLVSDTLKHEAERRLDVARFLGFQGQSTDLELWQGEKDKAFAEELSGLGSQTSTIPETTTPAAEKHARSLGMYGSIILTKKIVREMMPSIKALYLDLRVDPDEGGFPTICFAITFRESVDHAVELDDALQDTLFDQIPTDHRVHFSFAYHLE